MSLSTQRRATNSENPFEIFGQSSAYASRPAKPRPQSTAKAHYPTRPSFTNSQPRTQTVSKAKRKPHQLRFPLSLRKLTNYVILGVLLFALLPSPLQKRFYVLLGWRQASGHKTNPLPVDYTYISSPFGKRWGRQHQGIDFAAPYNAPIYATSAGKVIYSGWEAGYGKSVVIDHGNNIQTRYAHCSKLLVSVGQTVSKGSKIAKVGSTGHSTGPHLHFEVVVNGIRKNPTWYYPFQPTTNESIAQASH